MLRNGGRVVDLKDILRIEETLELSGRRLNNLGWVLGYRWVVDTRGIPNYAGVQLIANGCITEESAEQMLDVTSLKAAVDAEEFVRISPKEVGNLSEPWVYPKQLTEARRRAVANLAHAVGPAWLFGDIFKPLREVIHENDWEMAASFLKAYPFPNAGPEVTPTRIRRIAQVLETGADDFYS